MLAWRHILGGLLLWAGHFFAVYGIASVLPGTSLAALFILIATVLGLALAAWFLVQAVRARNSSSDKLQRWLHGLSGLGYALAALAIVYQGLPAIIA